MSPASALRAGLGTQVEIELISEDGAVETMALNLVTDTAADIDAGLVHIGTPLAHRCRPRRGRHGSLPPG